MEIKSQNQDYSQYFNGEVPSFQPGGSIDYSQISSMFSRTAETMELVSQYAPEIPKEVSYIFNFSNAGAYGVYIPALVEKMKTNELKSQLEQKGYKIGTEGNTMVAYPDDRSKGNDEIDKEIRELWNRINQGKSEALGINMNKVKSACEQNMSQLVNNAATANAQISNPQLLWDMLVMLELGATIVHEWEHSRGGDEGASESRERDFVAKTMPIIQQKYSAESGGEEMMAGSEIVSAKKNYNWYRYSQYTNYLPQSFRSAPTGSDLDGRFGRTPSADSSMSDWSMMAQQDQSVPIEERLGRGGNGTLSPDIKPGHNTIEEQLRKQTAADEKPNVRLIYEELLSKDRDDGQAYKSIEQLMEETRPFPIMIPLEKTSSLKKEATLFGWYNNLEISDGSTIPGLGDRVMAWDDRDECFSQEEDWIKKQPRYNPTYDLKGFYYRWIEPRFKPQLWDDMSQELSNTHPAKRFAAVEIDQDMYQILSILEAIKDRILSGKIKAARIIASGDIYPLIKRIVKCEGVCIKSFRFGESERGEMIYSIWAFDPSVEVESLRKAESRLQNKNAPADLDDLVEELLGFSHHRSIAVDEIVSAARQICMENQIVDLYAIGSYAREKIMGQEKPDVERLDFSTVSPIRNVQVGQLLASRLGVNIIRDCDFVYKGVKVQFSINYSKKELAQLSVLNTRIKNQLAIDLLRRDFTLNMFAYNVRSGEIEDPLNIARKGLRLYIIKTVLDPFHIVKKNPIVILRALKLKLKYGFEIDSSLQKAMITYSGELFKGKFSDFELIFARESISAEGSEEADKLFDEFGLWKLKKIK